MTHMERNNENMDSISIIDFKFDHNYCTVLEEKPTISQWCMKVTPESVERTMDTLRTIDGKVCLTTDFWTSGVSRSYLILTCHYIDDEWHLKSIILNVCYLPLPHKANEIAIILYHMVKEWGLENKIFSVTIDNTYNLNVMAGMLRDKLLSHSPLPINGNHFIFRCSAPIFNLIVNEGLKVISDAVSMVRVNVKYINSSAAAFSRFKGCVNGVVNPIDLELWLDVPTRWYSTYVMLVRAQKLKYALEIFAENDDQYPYCISHEHWEYVDEICLLLRPIYRVTAMFSGSNYPTLNHYVEKLREIESQLHRLSVNTNIGIRTMALSMLLEVKRYWSQNSIILGIAAMLDPRIKAKMLPDHVSRFYRTCDLCVEKFTEIKEAIVNLFNEYKGTFISSSIPPTSQSDPHMLLNDNANSKNLDLSFGSNSTNKTELDTYLDSPILKVSDEFNLIIWWRDQSLQFPILSRLAKDTLTIPVISALNSFDINARFKENLNAI